ncbi:MAG TPA: NAD(P)-binding domain-containing protein [Gemmatimonadales bacterium]
MQSRESIQTIIIGGGQAGLTMGYHLARLGAPFLILDANARVGDSWRQRWDSLRLFTPAWLDALEGLPFPGDPNGFPTKDQMADYLESYAAHFKLPVRSGVKVDRVAKSGGRFLVSAGDRQFLAEHVVIAMANYQVPRLPAFARDLHPDIVQFHSSDYRNPAQLKPGGVLIVGSGNSGAELAIEFARAGHPTWLSGRNPGEVPFRLDSRIARLILTRVIFRVVFHRILTISTPVGRRARPRTLSQATPLIRTKGKDLARAGVKTVPRTLGVRDGRPVLEDGQLPDVTNVIWCTGFEPSSSWVDMPVFDERGEPRHHRGVSIDEPGLKFVGRQFLYAMSSSMVHGISRDAKYIAEKIVSGGRAAEAGSLVVEETALPRANASVAGAGPAGR